MKPGSYPWPWLRQRHGPTRFPADPNGWCPVCRFENCRTEPSQAQFCRHRERWYRREAHEELLFIAALLVLLFGVPWWLFRVGVEWLLDHL